MAENLGRAGWHVSLYLENGHGFLKDVLSISFQGNHKGCLYIGLIRR